MADKHTIGVDLSHHVRKGAGEPGDADAGRGASAAKDAGRLVHTITPMAVDEAQAFGIKDEERRRYVRLDKGKVNILPPSRSARWFELVGQPLGNGTEIYPAGDDVQAIKPWTPPKVGEGITPAVMNAILDDIDTGPSEGHRYTNANSGERQAWHVVQSHCPDKTERQCRDLIKKWVGDKVLTVKPYKGPGMYHAGNGLNVNPAKRPKAA
jgi:hypothetical protein